MRKPWKDLSGGDRVRVLLVVAFLLIGAYGLVIYPATYNNLESSQSMLNRRKDRIAKRTQFTGKEAGANPRMLNSEIEILDKELVSLVIEIDAINDGWATVTSSVERQKLLLEIATLARDSGMDLQAMAAKEFSQSGDDAPEIVDPYLLRPVIMLSARADYWQLRGFLNGLKELSGHVSVMHLALQFRQKTAGGGKEKVDPKSGTLLITLELVI